MTYEQNVKAILESNFAGFKEEIIDIACKRICMLETKEETIDRVLEIIDSTKQEFVEDSIEGEAVSVTHAIDRIKELRSAVLALKGGKQG